MTTGGLRTMSPPETETRNLEIYEQDIFRLHHFENSYEINENIPEVTEGEDIDNEVGEALLAGFSLEGLGTTDETVPFSLRNTRPSSGFNNDRGSGAGSLFLSVADGNMGATENENFNQVSAVSAWASDAEMDRQQDFNVDKNNNGDLFLTTIADLLEAFPAK